MSKIEFGTYTPEQIAKELKRLRPDQLSEVIKHLAFGDKKAGLHRLPTLVKGEPFRNDEGEQCGLCDSKHAHEHPMLKCSGCGEQGLSENMVTHVCAPGKTLKQVFTEEEGEESDRPKLQALNDIYDAMEREGFEEQWGHLIGEAVYKRRHAAEVERIVTEHLEKDFQSRLKQLKINQDWLIERIDHIHQVLCPGRIATWQQRGTQAETAAELLVKACEPFIHFITQFERQPLAKSHDEFYGIHGGTQYEATLRLSDMKKLRDLLRPLPRSDEKPVPTKVTINGRKVTLTDDDCIALTYQRVVDLADTHWGKKALHSVTFHDRITGHSGILDPGRSVVPTEGMIIDACVTSNA